MATEKLFPGLLSELAKSPSYVAAGAGIIPISSIVEITIRGPETIEILTTTGSKYLCEGEDAAAVIRKLASAHVQQALGTPALLTTEELAWRYQVDARTIKSWAIEGIIPCLPITQRCLRFDPIACDEMIRKRATVRVRGRRRLGQHADQGGSDGESA